VSTRTPFSQSVAIVTGAASGIGKALCQQLAASGATVILADLQGEQAELVAKSLRDQGGRASAFRLDVTELAAVTALVEQVYAEHGRLDYLFNNAGIGVGGEARDFDEQDWKQVLDVNVHGVIHGVMAAYPRMVKAGHGYIVNTGSVTGLFPLPGEISYTASKFAVVGLSHTLRAEAAALGVRVSVVCPGKIQTPIYETSKVVGFDRAHVFDLWPEGVSAEDCAAQILRGVAANRATIVITLHARLLWAAYRLSPRLAEFVGKRYMTQMRKHRLDAEPQMTRRDRARHQAGEEPRLRASLAGLATRRGVEPWFDRFTHTHVHTKDGTKLAIEMILEAGPGRPTVVFMPGTNAYALLYGEFLTALADAGLNVIGFDPRGHGRSEGRGGSYTLPELVADFAEVVEYAQSQMDGPILAAGSSQGGIAAFYLAASGAPIAGAICHNAADLSDPSSARLTRYPRLGRLFKPALLGLAKFLPEVRVPMSAYLDLKKEPVRGMGNAHKVLHQDPLLVPYVRLKTLASLGSAALARPVEAIETPVLFLQAGADTIFPTEYMTTLYQRLTCPKRMHIYPGLPHYLVVDHIEMVVADVVGWIGETCA